MSRRLRAGVPQCYERRVCEICSDDPSIEHPSEET
jgi:hypothetical protein